jgi:hypothetical protein
MKSLLDAVNDYLTPDTIKKISTLVGETPDNTERAMDSIIPTLLSGATKLADSPGGDNQLMNMITHHANDGSILNNLGERLGGGNATQGLMSSGRDIIKLLFGGKLNSAIETLANSVGIKSSTISSLLSVGAPLVLGVLGKERVVRGLGASGLARMLIGERSMFSQLMPSSLGSLLGASDSGATETRMAEPTRAETARAPYGSAGERSTGRWLWPVFGLAVLGFLLYALWPRFSIAPEQDVAKRNTSSGMSARQESGLVVQGPTATVTPPETAKLDTTMPPSDKDSVTSGSEVKRVNRAPSPADVDVRQVQVALRNQGQNPGPIDGIIGVRMHEALRQFQKANGLRQTGSLDEATLEKLGFNR